MASLQDAAAFGAAGQTPNTCDRGATGIDLVSRGSAWPECSAGGPINLVSREGVGQHIDHGKDHCPQN